MNEVSSYAPHCCSVSIFEKAIEVSSKEKVSINITMYSAYAITALSFFFLPEARLSRTEFSALTLRKENYDLPR